MAFDLGNLKMMLLEGFKSTILAILAIAPIDTLLASSAKPGFTAPAMAHWQGRTLSVRWVISRRIAPWLLTRTALIAGLSGLFLLHGQKPIPPMPLSVILLRTISESRVGLQVKNERTHTKNLHSGTQPRVE
jgi:hypothetical protein